MYPPKFPSTFRLIFLTVLCLTFSSGGTAVYLANQPNISEQQVRILDSALAMWTAGSTAMIGMLSSSANNSNESNHPNEPH